ncbi:MAG: trigger factor [Chitinophagales bacterium]
MQVTKVDIDKANAILKLSVKKEDFEPKIKKTLNEYGKNAEIKGFRKGHVPKGMIRKMYGNNILMDTINSMLSDEVNKFIVENKIDVLGHPIPKDGQAFDMDINSLKDFDFEYELGIAPEFELTYLAKKPKFEREVPTIEEKMVDEEVERMQKQLGTVEDVDTIEDDTDMLTVKFDALDADGNVAENGISNSTSISLEMIEDKKVAKTLKKLKKGEILDLDVFTTFSQDEESIAKHILNSDKATVGDSKFRMTLEGIKRTMPAKMDEEFFKKIDPKGEMKTEEDLRAKIKEDVGTYFSKQADNKMFNKVYENLIAETKLDLPDEFLKRWIRLTNEKPITEEQVVAEYPAFRNNLIWSLIVKNIKKDAGIDVTQEEIKTKTAEGIKAQFAQYGMADFGGEELESFVNNMIQKEEHVNQTRDAILEEKIFAYLKDNITIKDKSVSLEEFNKQDK